MSKIYLYALAAPNFVSKAKLLALSVCVAAYGFLGENGLANELAESMLRMLTPEPNPKGMIHRILSKKTT